MIAGSNVGVDARTVNVKLVTAGLPPGMEVDATAYLLGPDGKVRSDGDMVFYGQQASPERSVVFGISNSVPEFSVDLEAVPATVDRIAFCLTIDAAASRGQSFGQLQAARIEIHHPGTPHVFSVETPGRKEAAMVMGELYRRNGGWKFRAIGQGFDGGLKPLAESFGVVVEEAPAPAPSLVDLRKAKTVDLAKRDPLLAASAKKALVSLVKRGVGNLRAKVTLVLDISASMDKLYNSGSMDVLVRRMVALGFQIDDDGDIEVILFGKYAHAFGSVDTGNYTTFTRDMRAVHALESATMYGEAIAMVRERHAGSTDGLPVFVLFVTDGGTQDVRKSKNGIMEASHEPIFWQFVAIGAHEAGEIDMDARRLPRGFDFLQMLDDMPGRYIDNASFFAVPDPGALSDDALYGLIFEEFPEWLDEARAKGLVS